MISYQFGGDLFDYPGYFLTYSDGVRMGTFNMSKRVAGNYWKKPGDVAEFPKPIMSNPYRSDKFSSRATNPFLIYNAAKDLDPDVDVNGYRQTDTPTTRQFLFGLNFSF